MPDTMLEQASPPTRWHDPDRSDSLDKLATALAKAQAEIEGAVKDKSNPAFRSKYADLGAVWDAIRDPLTKNQLSVVQFPRRTQTGVAVKTMLLHASGQWIAGEMEVPCTKQDAHGVGSATTYARRFSLSAVVGVAPMDDDGNGATRNVPNDWVQEARQDGLIRPDAINKETGEIKSQYDIDAAAKAKQWTDAAIGTLNLSGQTKDSLQAWWKANKRKLDGLEERHGAQYERLLTAFDNALEAAGAQAA